MLLLPLPAIAAGAWVGAWRNLWAARDWRPFLFACTLVLAAGIGLGVSIWPYAIPGVLTLSETASAPRTQHIVAWVLVCILPVVIG
ncbi:cytochrome d ubiquinol oxidase subunit II [Sphingomonas xinjiangensis]|uniref:cytochrome d ubiquinol oxidase subunit II n=1 Tax=Sphingomonas xinjiangensis TaxID=643568 RepID=UPI001FE824B1|nr:cytochrome d ubiquinol oxidase subunit II [Sphingomonas xinjiangensis]